MKKTRPQKDAATIGAKNLVFIRRFYMDNIITFICECCGKEHNEWPALTFISPDNYNCLSEEQKEKIAEIDSDTCTINYSDQVYRFIRCVLFQKVNDNCQDLDYGLWVSLSEKVIQIILKTLIMIIMKHNILDGFVMISRNMILKKVFQQQFV